MANRKIIMIGGAPTTGKSTMAGLVARHFNIPWISTDQLRNVMRNVTNRERHPKLFNPEGYTGERFLTEFSKEEIVNMEFQQGEAAWPGVKSFIDDDYTWKDGFVVEGVNILPHLVSKDFGNNKEVQAVFLVDEDADRIKDVIFNRGLWDDADKYSDDVKGKEIEWVLEFSHKLKTEAKKHGFPCIEVTKSKEDLDAVLDALS